jgi:putative colanic acid biosynthesis UDP-glucose lipid carrier transferase
MFTNPGKPKAVLQRRSSVSNAIQAGLDGIAVIGVALALVEYHIGALTYEYTVLLLLLMGILAVVYDRYALYRSNSNFTGKVVVLLKAWTITFLLLLLIAFLTQQIETYSRLLVGEIYVLGFLVQVLLHALVRTSHRAILRHRHNPDNVIMIGEGRLANYLNQKISLNPWLGERVVGSVMLDEASDSAESTLEGAPPRLGFVKDLPELIEKHNIQTAYIVIPLDASKVLEEIYFTLLDKHVAIHWVPDIFSLRLVNHSVKEIAGIPVLTLSETPLTGVHLLAKSVEDFILSSLILVLIGPVLALVALAVKLDSPGPVFFRQKRAGWNGKTFRIWKFRSMYVHQPENGKLKQAEKNDPRITRVGAFIRKTSLDELPQIFNVLMGDMSLVGPRPHAIQHDEEYSRRIDDYFARHNIKPGITGLAQVRGLRGETRDIDQMAQRIEADIEYINNWSVWLDIAILIRTTAAITGKNAY